MYVKVPVTTTRGESLADVVRELSHDGVQVNVTALFTPSRWSTITAAVADGAPSYISVFAGRIADTGRDPVPIMRESLEIMRAAPRAELIWASPRELLNVVQADTIGCHIITVHERRAGQARHARQGPRRSSRWRPSRCSTATPVTAGFTL